MATILLYSPFDQRSRDTESLMVAFKNQGHRVLSLSQADGNQIHDYLKKENIETYTHILPGPKNTWYYLRHIIYFIRFCKKHKVDVVYSHLEPANLVAAVGQYFIGARVSLCRHHITEAALYKFDRSFFYRLTYKLAKHIIVVSNRARQYMIEVEKIKPEKITHINLGYDFELYPKPDVAAIRAVKGDNPAPLFLITVGRFTEFKRPAFSILVLKKLIDRGINAQLILLGRGEQRQELNAIAEMNNLTDKVIIPGYVNNVPDYLSACDFMVHPSLSESSCVAVKEAGYYGLPVIACAGVGDFDEYIIHGKSGFLVNAQTFIEDTVHIISDYYTQHHVLDEIRSSLRASVIEHFGLPEVIQKYESINRI